MRILAVGAHPDDIELICAGTLAKCSKRGDKIFMSYLCKGDKGGYGISAQELTKIREKEAGRSAAVIGAEILGGFFPDLEFFVNEDTNRQVVELIRIAQPDVIITHAPNDYMMDHMHTSKLVVDASFTATLPNLKTEHPATRAIPPIFFMDTIGGTDFIPTEFVDISDFIDIKEKMLLCHQSQARWLLEHDKIDYAEFMRDISRFRGIQCGVRYAEAFRQYQAWGRIKTVRLLP